MRFIWPLRLGPVTIVAAALVGVFGQACESAGPNLHGGSGGTGGGVTDASGGSGGSGAISSGGSPGAGSGGASAVAATCGAADSPRALPGFQLTLPDGNPPPQLSQLAQARFMEYDATGTASVSRVDVPCTTCAAGTFPTIRIEIAGSDGQTWVLVALPTDDLVDAWLATAQEVAGTQVSLTARYGQKFQTPNSSGFVLTDSAGLIFAANDGPFLDTTSAPSPLSIREGDPICINVSACDFVTTTLVFRGDSTATVGLASDGELMIGGRDYGARNGGAGYIQGSCNLIDPPEYADLWAVWRRAAP